MQFQPAQIQAAVRRLSAPNDYDGSLKDEVKELLAHPNDSFPSNMGVQLRPSQPSPAVAAREAAYGALPSLLTREILRSRLHHVSGRKRPRVTVDNVDPETGITNGSELGRYVQQLRNLRGQDMRAYEDVGLRQRFEPNFRGTMDSP